MKTLLPSPTPVAQRSGLVTARQQRLGEADASKQRGGTLGKQGQEGPRAQILKRRSQKEGALAVSHRLAHNNTGVWVCERERVQARMGVCVCVIAGVCV